MSGLSDFLMEFQEMCGNKYTQEEIKRMGLNKMLEIYDKEKEKLKKIADKHGYKEVKRK